MRVHRPELTVEGDRALVTATFESERLAFPRQGITIGCPRRLVGRLDLSATPWVPIAVALAAAVGEDALLDAPADPVILRGAANAAAVMAGWWGWRQPLVRADARPASPEPDRGHGLLFTRGVDSWASYLRLRDDPVERPVSHLISVFGVNRSRSAAEAAAVRQGTIDVADALGVELIDLDSDVRTLLDPHLSWESSHGAALIACGLLLAPLLDRLTIASTWKTGERSSWGSHVDLDRSWGSGAMEVVHHLQDLDRVEKSAIVARDPMAMRSLLVCWEGADAGNCGRCPKCLRTMTCLYLIGALDDCPAFERPLTAAAVRELADNEPGLDYAEYVRQLLAYLPPGSELAAAWRRHLGEDGWPPGPVEPLTIPMSGPGLQERIHAATTATSGRADDRSIAPPMIGWERDLVPLRPRIADRRAVLAAVATNAHRDIGWVVAEPADPLVTGDPWTAAVADRAEQLWGAGLCYLAGIGWAGDQRPALDSAAVGSLLNAARARLWWRATGTFDALRLIETIERGCLPVQVMPPAEVVLLRAHLPAVLASLVVGIDDIGEIDPWRCDDLLEDATAWVLRGSAERDLRGEAARWPLAARHG